MRRHASGPWLEPPGAGLPLLIPDSPWGGDRQLQGNSVKSVWNQLGQKCVAFFWRWRCSKIMRLVSVLNVLGLYDVFTHTSGEYCLAFTRLACGSYRFNRSFRLCVQNWEALRLPVGCCTSWQSVAVYPTPEIMNHRRQPQIRLIQAGSIRWLYNLDRFLVTLGFCWWFLTTPFSFGGEHVVLIEHKARFWHAVHCVTCGSCDLGRCQKARCFLGMLTQTQSQWWKLRVDAWPQAVKERLANH